MHENERVRMTLRSEGRWPALPTICQAWVVFHV